MVLLKTIPVTSTGLDQLSLKAILPSNPISTIKRQIRYSALRRRCHWRRSEDGLGHLQLRLSFNLSPGTRDGRFFAVERVLIMICEALPGLNPQLAIYCLFTLQRGPTFVQSLESTSQNR